MIVSAEEFYYLCHSSNREEYCRVSSDTASAEVWLDILKKYPEKYMQDNVLYNSNLPLGVLYVLAEDDDENVRCDIAGREYLDDYLIKKLMKDPDENVRGKLAYNSLLTKEQLEMLAQDSSEWVSNRAKDALMDLSVTDKQ